MTDWVRLWHDMPTDPKWRVIARKSGQPLVCVIAVFNLMMVNASGNAKERGTLSAWNNEDMAAALDLDADQVSAILDAMQGRVLDGDKLSGWQKRQPKREDNTASLRKASWLERKRTQENAQEPPETETETDIIPLREIIPPEAKKPVSVRSQKNEGEEQILAAGCDQQTLDDWKAVRRAKRAGPITPAVVRLMISEAAKTCIPVQQAVEIAAARGWQSFKSEWMHENRGRGPPADRSTGMFAALRQLEENHASGIQNRSDGSGTAHQAIASQSSGDWRVRDDLSGGDIVEMRANS